MFVEDMTLWGEIGCAIGNESDAGDAVVEYTGDQWEPDDETPMRIGFFD